MYSFVKKLTAFALASLMLLSFPACARPDSDSEDSTIGSTVSEEETDIYADLPRDKFNGYEFNILQYKETTAATATVLTERTGNPIEDALYERMIAVEDKLDVTFVNHLGGVDDSVETLRNCIVGGLDEYDTYWGHSSRVVSNLLSKGYLVDMNQVVSLDFSKPWWDDTANEYLALDEHLYMAFGDINVYLFDFHSVILFNKDVTDEYGEDLYGMVQNGDWTMDQFIRLSTELALADPNGGTGYERMAYTGYAPATMYGFLHGADVDLFTYDEDGIPEMGSVSESYLDVMTAYSNLFKDKKLCNTLDGAMITTFASGKATFVSCGIGQLGALRAETLNYGLVPFPKKDKAQESYISFVSNQIQPMVIPKSASKVDRTGVILENLAAESYRTVRPQYFDVLLESKYVRDPESLGNMQMIFDCETRFELEHIYDWGNFHDQVTLGLTGGANQFPSTVKRFVTSMNKKIDETLDYLSMND